MNALSYKVIFSKRLGTLVAVGEHASAAGKSASGQASRAVITSFAEGFVGALRFGFATVALACLSMGVTSAQSTLPKISSTALPQGGSVNSGSVAISTSGTQMALLQTTEKASVNWQSFNIGSNASVNIVQPSASAVMLNRVVGNDPSQILGKLSANGQVILLNPNGIAFGKDGSVTASSFTASTFALSEQDFAANVYKYQRNGSTAQVVNQGTIQTQSGGFVALVGASVTNEGKITAPQGDVVLAAAESVTLPAATPTQTTTPANVSVRMSKRVRLEVTPAAINTAVNNAQSGVIVTEGGQVLMQAASLSDAVASVTHSGRIDTTAQQAGAVTLLADGGQIKVSGSITANSTASGLKGADIIIGRDIETGVLAKAADVSGAVLESNQGFVETSGDVLSTTGTRVKAAEWLLDPSDITISNSADSNVTGFSPADITPNGGTGTSSVLQVSTIQNAINAGTNVTIKTTNASNATGAGNITIANALAFANNSNTDATLSLIADNGITQSAGASLTTSAVVGKTGLVNVSMTSNGNYQGLAAASASSAGIRLNSTINTNGDVTLSGTTNNSGAASASNAVGVDTASAAGITAKNISITGSSQSSFGIQSASALTATGNITLNGTSKNWVGVVTTGAVNATGAINITGVKTTAAGYQGANISSNLTGASVSVIANSYGNHGIDVGAAYTVKSTSGDVYIEGTASNTAIDVGQNSSSGAQISGNVDAAGKATIKGITSDAGLYQGLIISKTVKGSSVELTGNSVRELGVSLGASASVTATAGSVKIEGTSGLSEGVRVGTAATSTTAISATTDVSLIGTSGNSANAQTGSTGVKIWDGSTISAGNVTTTGSINVTGTVHTQSGQSGDGLNFQRYPNAARLTATGDIAIYGTVTGAGGGSGLVFNQSGTTGKAPMMNAGGKFTLRGNNRTTGVNGSAVISGVSGIQVTAGSDIAIQAETQNASVNAINFTSGTNGVSGNASLKSTSGNVLIQVNQGAINFTNALPTNYVTGTYTALTDINGKYITIDNTGAGMAIGAGTSITGSGGTLGASIANGGSISATGVITKGSGTSTYTSGAAINLNSSAGLAITASENVNISAINNAGTQSGLYTGSVTTISGKNVAIDGSSLNANGVYTNAAVNATGGDVQITGTSSAGSALSLQGEITASQNVTITGTNTAAGNAAATVYSNKAVTATNGTISVTANTSGTTASALQLASGAGLTTNNRAITLSTDSLNVDTTGGAGANINAGTNTVTLQNRSSGVLVSVGGSDVGNATATSRTLGLTNAELNRVTAGSLLIGSNTAGNLTVSSATTLADSRGNISLVSGGNIALSSNLETTGNGQSLTLTAANGSISGAGNITTAAGNTASITVDAATAGTLSGLISGGGSLVKQGAATTTLTGANNYSGTTTISAGTLQVGNGGASGTLGSGAVVDNAALVFNRDATTDLTVSGAVSGTGTVAQSGTGKTILAANNSYSGATTVSAGTLQVGNAGATGTLGNTSSVTLSNNANLRFNRTANTAIDKAISGVGNVTANITGDLALTSNIALTGTNTINLTASGSITETAGSLAATNLYMTATNGGIGATGNRIQSDVTNLNMSSAGNQYVTEANALNLSSRTTSNGSVDVTTTLGTLTIGTVNSVAGISANGTGNVTLSGTAAGTDPGIMLNQAITGTDVILSGTATGSGNGIHNAGTALTSRGAMTLTGSSTGNGAGIYSFAGSMTGAGLITLSGTDNANQGLNLHGGLVITNTGAFTAGQDAVWLKGSSSATGVSMNGVTINNNSTNGITRVEALNGNIDTQAAFSNAITNASTAGAVIMSAGNGSATSSGSINVSTLLNITQNGNAGVVVSTSGTGNVTAPKIINAGTGDIVVAAGTSIAAGTGTGGQILTVANNTLTQTNAAPGKTYVYSGSADTTGVLSNLSAGYASLYYQGTSQALNAGFNQGFDANHANDMTVPGGGSASSTQVFFRSTTKPGFSMTLANASKSYGDTDPTLTATNGATLTNAYAGVGGNNTFAVKSADVIAAMTGSRVTGENVGTYAYTLSASSFNTTLTAQPNLVIGKRDITLSTITASNKTYNGFVDATITSGTFGNLYNNETLLISGAGTFSSKDAADGKTVTVADTTTLTKTNGTGNWNNYNLTTTTKTTTANITKATLSVTANADAKFVTQADALNFNGVSYSGFVGGDTSAVLGGALAISRTNALTDVAAATYAGVLVPTGLTATNYTIGYTNGNYTIVPADRLLINTTSQTVTYGTTPTFTTTAKYLDSHDNQIKVLTQTGTNNNYTYNDGAGTTISLALKPYTGATAATLSTSGNTVVGTYDVKDTAYVQNGTNFNGTPVFIGTVSVAQKSITPSASGASKVYDGTTSASNVVIGMTGKVTNDVVRISGNGAFNQKDVGTNLSYSVSGITLASADAGNYYLSGGPISISANDGAITAKALTLAASSVANKVYDGTTNATVNSPGTLQGSIGTETLTLNGITGTFASASIGSAKPVTVAATLADGTNGGLASNYTLASATAYADITSASNSGGGGSPVNPPKPIIPSESSESANASNFSTSGENNILVVPALRQSGESCTPDNLEDCLCKTQETRAIEGIQICYQPKKTANASQGVGRKS